MDVMVAVAKVAVNGSFIGDITAAYPHESLALNPNYKPHKDVYFLTLANAPFDTLEDFKKQYVVPIKDVSTNPDRPSIKTRRYRYSIMQSYDQLIPRVVPFSLVTITDNA